MPERVAALSARKKSHRRGPANRSAVGARRLPPPERGGVLVHPKCVDVRREDLEEVYAMLAADEADVAMDELRWLLNECQAFIEAHKLLGELAVAAGDVPLAAGHYGYGFKLGDDAILASGLAGPWPAEHPDNAAFFESGQGYAECLLEQRKPRKAASILRRLLTLDPSDPIGLKPVLDTVALYSDTHDDETEDE